MTDPNPAALPQQIEPWVCKMCGFIVMAARKPSKDFIAGDCRQHDWQPLPAALPSLTEAKSQELSDEAIGLKQALKFAKLLSEIRQAYVDKLAALLANREDPKPRFGYDARDQGREGTLPEDAGVQAESEVKTTVPDVTPETTPEPK